jgi:hypothetical protein
MPRRERLQRNDVAIIDPYPFRMADEVAELTFAESHFRRSIVWLTRNRLAADLARVSRFRGQWSATWFTLPRPPSQQPLRRRDASWFGLLR